MTFPAESVPDGVVGVVVGLDDAVSHAFGVWTPLDAVWQTGIYPVPP